MSSSEIIELEKAVLAGMLLEEVPLNKAVVIMDSKYFAEPKHAIIYDAIKALNDKRQAVDILTVTNQLRKVGKLASVGGAYYITDITMRVNSGANIETHCYMVIEAYIEREIKEIPKRLNDPKKLLDAFEQLEEIKNYVHHIEKCITNNSVIHGIAAYEEAALKLFDKKPLHLQWGLSSLNGRIRGINKGDFILVAGRPGMGKTDFALYLLQNICKQKKHCIIFSMEMTADALYKRILQFILQIDSNDVYTLSMEQYETSLKIFKRDFEPYLHIIETGTVTNALVESKVAEFKAKYGEDFGGIIIDYLQLMEGDGNGDTEIVTRISKRLKQTAKNNLVPIIALSQLSRKVEERADKRPMQSDLRQSGSLEQDADVIIFLYREDYYFKDQPDYAITNKLEVIVNKLREGNTGIVQLYYDAANKVIADTAPLPDSAFTVNEKTGEVFKNINGQNSIDDFNSEKDKPTPF